MNKKQRQRRRRCAEGFTLIEALIALLILTVVMVGVFAEINKAQTYYKVEDKKADLTSQERDFVDQFTRDLHQAGFPSQVILGNAAAFNGLTANTNFTSTVEMTGDLGDGNGVSTVTYTYDSTGGTLQRAVNGAATIAVQNVTSATFTAYDITGAATTTLANVRSIRISFSTQSGVDATNQVPVQVNMTGMARLPNNN